ncbi:hypothetical protein PFISCL1PPCAC_1426, partial [Pristionchus fissidentatus]
RYINIAITLQNPTVGFFFISILTSDSLKMKLFVLIALTSTVYGQTIQEIEKLFEIDDEKEEIDFFLKTLHKHYPNFVPESEMNILASELVAVANYSIKSGVDVTTIAPLWVDKMMKLGESMNFTYRSLSNETTRYMGELSMSLMMSVAFANRNAKTMEEFEKEFNKIYVPIYDDFNKQSESIKTELRKAFPVVFHFISMKVELLALLRKHEEKFNAMLAKYKSQ